MINRLLKRSFKYADKNPVTSVLAFIAAGIAIALAIPTITTLSLPLAVLATTAIPLSAFGAAVSVTTIKGLAKPTVAEQVSETVSSLAPTAI